MKEYCEHYTLDCQAEKMGCEGCGYYRKNADDMFEELGLTKDIIYYNEDAEEIIYLGKNKYSSAIKFNIRNKCINVYYGQENHAGAITMEILQAINKKVEELGWK